MHQMRQNNRCSGPTSNWVGSMSEPLERASVGLQISIRESDDVIILDLRGRSTIDGGESEVLSSSLKKLVANGVRKLVLNLANMSQVDSSGVSIIVGTAVSLRAKGNSRSNDDADAGTIDLAHVCQVQHQLAHTVGDQLF